MQRTYTKSPQHSRRWLARGRLVREAFLYVMRSEPHILFVDDDPDIREMVQALLSAAGFQVSTPDNAGDVLQLAATERFDALVLDYWMPQVTGVELCRRIRRFDQNTPIPDLFRRNNRSR